MEPTQKPRIKICCVNSVKEAWIAIRCGASAVGLVSEMPSGPGVITEDLIAQISTCVPPAVSTFLLTSKQDAASIIAQQRRCGVSTIQLCDRLRAGSYRQLREAMPGIALVQVIHITGRESVEEAHSAATYVDALLLDSGNQSSAVKELGGTGRTHDWTVSKTIRESVNIPIFLAGGLNPENVADAVRVVGPYAVDVCSGVRTNGVLDEAKLIEFVRQSQIAFA